MSEPVKYPVLEIFQSFQGEGAMIGMPCNFVRFAGCNLACSFCDTGHSWKMDNPDIKWMTAQEIINNLKGEIHLTVLTGGEPCLQPLPELIDMIHIQLEDMLVSIETNGTQATPENADWVTCSPKPMADYVINGKCFFSELKYVVSEDFDLDCIPEQARTAGSVWLQPCDYGPTEEGKAKTQESKNKIMKLVQQYPFLRAGIQLHKWYGAE